MRLLSKYSSYQFVNSEQTNVQQRIDKSCTLKGIDLRARLVNNHCSLSIIRLNGEKYYVLVGMFFSLVFFKSRVI